MGGRKILVTVSEEQHKALERLADEQGLRVSTFAKSVVAKAAHNSLEGNGGVKSLLVTLTNYDEVKDYVASKKFGSIESFATFAMAQYMAKYPVKSTKKG